MTMMRMIIIKKTMMIIGSLNNDDVEDNENVEKANRFVIKLKKQQQQLCSWIKLDCTFRWCRSMTCLISVFWTAISNYFFLFLNLDQSFRI